ncbi:winged helix-turn-helix domain-containing protein [Methylophaga sp.]|uniref:winged helix-turn-helix domain-containing protein n=1 Tax=Methylophaga sp. TaxID=2024840 RepID=UPI00271EBA73|nr:winged helix-turn-helix domain-containing protein [Methylophaga sp.]MDO8828240.1 winged helix-turn-helix domain-containing protein [Methylophaga sp.]
MSDVLIVIFVLYIIYLIMKKPKSTPETAVPKKPSPAQTPPEKVQAEEAKATIEVPAVAKVTPAKAAPKKSSPAQNPPENVQAEEAKATIEVPSVAEVTPAKAAPKKSSPAQKPSKKVQAEQAEATIEVPVASKVTPAQAAAPIKPAVKAAPKKPNVLQKAPKTAEDLFVEPVATSDITVKDRIGLTAGLIWQYLADHGATPVAKLMRELPEEEKIIHRSIGWLAQEGKITLDIVDRAETIALKD